MRSTLLSAAVGVLFLLAPATAGAATVYVQDGVLHVVGTAGRERIDLDLLSTGPIIVSNLGIDDALEAGAGCVLSTPNVACAADGVQRAVVELGDGDDEYLPGRFSLPTRVEGGKGDDTLYDDAGVDEFLGGEGDDVLWMDSGPDADADVLNGGPGFDRASYGQWRGSDGLLRLSLDDVANDGIPGEGDNIHTDIEALNGGYGDDTLIGTPGDDELEGGEGNDVLDGLGGDDLLTGGPDADQLNGGDGFDLADYSDSYAPVTLTLDGQANDGATGEGDRIGADVEGAIGGYGNDLLTGNAADGVLVGLEGNDRLIDPGGEDLLTGDDGDDEIEAADGASDEVSCGIGSDRVWRDAGDVLDPDCERVTDGPRVAEPAATPTPTATPTAFATPTPPPGRVRATPIFVRPPVTVTPPPDRTAPTAALLRAGSRARVKTLRRNGLTVTVRCNELCRLDAQLTGSRGTVASAVKNSLSLQERPLRLRFTAAGKRALRPGRYKLTLTLADRAGNETTIVRTLRVS